MSPIIPGGFDWVDGPAGGTPLDAAELNAENTAIMALKGAPNGFAATDIDAALAVDHVQRRRLKTVLGAKGAAYVPIAAVVGFGTPIGNPANFNQVTVYLCGGVALTQPTSFRAVVKSVNVSGTVLAEATLPASGLPVSPSVAAFAFNFGAMVNPSGGQLWLEVYADHEFGFLKVSSVIVASPQAMYSTALNGDVAVNWNLGGGTTQNFYAEFSYDPGASNLIIPTGRPSAGYGSTFLYESSTFSGWIMPLGVAQNFNRCEFEVRPWSQQPITQVRVRVLDGTSPAAAVALTDQTLNVVTQRGVAKTIQVDLPQMIQNPAGDTLWLEWRCDGYTGIRSVGALTATKPYYFASSLDITQAAPVSAQDSTLDATYVRLSRVDSTQANPAGGGAHAALVKQISQQPWLNVYSSLPAGLKAVTGREMNIYFGNFLRSDVPLSAYSFVVTCAKGEQDQARWFYTPVDGDAGAVAWSVAVYWGAILVGTFSTTITFVAAASGTGVTRKLLAIGDSLTQFGYWLSELVHLFVGDPMAVTPIGTLSTTIADAGGTSRTVAHDAVSGKTLHYMATDPASPFVFAGVFNFPTFLTTNSLTMAATDTVHIELGTNDVFQQQTDQATALQIRGMLVDLATIITSIKTAPTPPRIVLSTTIPPCSSQDGFGVIYPLAGQAFTRDRFARNVGMWNEALVQAYDGGAVSGVTVCALHLNLDTVNGFPTTATAFAARVTGTYAKQQNSVHPIPSGASGGFWQMADTIYSYLKATA